MAKLQMLKPLIGAIKPTLAAQTSTARDDYRGWYKTSRWQKLRWSILVRDRFTCQMSGCGRVEPDTSLLVADHVIPHRGDVSLFWDDRNLQCLCKTCHDSLKQSFEARECRLR